MIKTTLQELVPVLRAAPPTQDAAVSGISTDSRALIAGCLFVALRGERFDGHAYVEQAAQSGAAATLVDRPVDTALPCLQVADTRLALGRLAAWWRGRFVLPLVAVTGSNGKTTVKEMLARIFAQSGPVLATQGNLNNDIGLPLTLCGLNAAHRHAVIEMGANHPGEIAYLSGLARPDVALITQCAPAHLEGFGSIAGVAQAKGEIFSGLPAHGVAVINHDDGYAQSWRQTVRDLGLRGTPPFGPLLEFGLGEGAHITARDLRDDGLSSRFVLVTPWGESTLSLPLAGRHNVSNALAAAACALAAGAEIDAVAAGLETMAPVKGRLQSHLTPQGKTVLDDTYNANPASLAAGIEVLAACPAPRWLVLGDMLELGAAAAELHRAAGLSARRAGVDRLFALGPLGAAAAESFGPGGRHFSDHAALRAALREELPAPATVLVKGSRSMRMDQVVTALLQDDKA